jgi:competence protein ComEA
MKALIKSLVLSVMLGLTSFAFAEVNVNNDDAQTIAEGLNGIGLKKAQAIVAWRNENGNFKDLVSLEQVKGIGAKILEKNKDNIKF